MSENIGCDLCATRTEISEFMDKIAEKLEGWGYIESYMNEAYEKLDDLAGVLSHECDYQIQEETP